MNFNEIAEFTKEFKRLAKKYPTLSQDFAVFKKVLPSIEFSLDSSNKNFEILKEQDCKKVIKARLRVRCLKGLPKTRIIFILRVENDVVDFIEIYTKNDKAREDAARIDFYLNR
jgi:hypothetical protein